MQAVRGMRLRRSIEIIADYMVKHLNQDKLTEREIQETDFVPHPNDHLRMFGSLAGRTEEVLKTRCASLIRLDQPLLITGDEPVLIMNDAEPGQKRRSRPEMYSKEFALHEAGRGFANAEAIALPITPSVVLFYGSSGARNLPIELELFGADAESFAEDCNRLVIEAAIDWVAASPAHRAFASMRMRPQRPLLTVHDYGSSAAARVNTTPARRPIRRLRVTMFSKQNRLNRKFRV